MNFLSKLFNVISSIFKKKEFEEKSYKQYLKDSDIDKVKPDKYGTIEDPFNGKDYADYKMPRERKKKK